MIPILNSLNHSRLIIIKKSLVECIKAQDRFIIVLNSYLIKVIQITFFFNNFFHQRNCFSIISLVISYLSLLSKFWRPLLHCFLSSPRRQFFIFPLIFG